MIIYNNTQRKQFFSYAGSENTGSELLAGASSAHVPAGYFFSNKQLQRDFSTGKISIFLTTFEKRNMSKVKTKQITEGTHADLWMVLKETASPIEPDKKPEPVVEEPVVEEPVVEEPVVEEPVVEEPVVEEPVVEEPVVEEPVVEEKPEPVKTKATKKKAKKKTRKK